MFFLSPVCSCVPAAPGVKAKTVVSVEVLFCDEGQADSAYNNGQGSFGWSESSPLFCALQLSFTSLMMHSLCMFTGYPGNLRETGHL